MKLRNKLILSCAALAAVATTAVSTTFAWYTANTEVSATGITAATKSGANETLLISKTGAQKSWGASVDLEMTASNVLVPLEYDSTGDTYKTWNMTTSTTTGGPALTQAPSAVTSSNGIYQGEYLSFMLYFKSGSTDNLKVKLKNLTLVNTTAAAGLPTKTIMTETGLPTMSSTTYKVDALRALTFATNAGSSTEVDSGYANQSSSATRVAYNLHNYQTVNDSFGAKTVTSGYNCHEYYDAIKGTDITTAAAALSNQSETLTAMPVADSSGAFASAIELGTTGAGSSTAGALDSILAIRFDVYLDGWDIACFDACQGQTFTIALEFASEKVTS